MKSKEVKRAEAQERQAEYDALLLTEKVDRLIERRGNSDRQRRRLGMLPAWEEEILGINIR